MRIQPTLAFFLLFVAAPAAHADPIRDCENAKDIETRIQACDKVIDGGNVNPETLAIAHFSRGVAYETKGDLDRGITDYSTAITIKPDFAEAYANRGVLFGRTRQFLRSTKDLDRAIELNPGYGFAYLSRGSSYYLWGKFDLAIADLTKALELEPDSPLPLLNRGKAYRRKRDYDRAIADFSKAIDGYEKNNSPRQNIAMILTIRGETYRQKVEFDKAIADFDHALSLNPAQSMARARRAATRSQVIELGDADNKSREDLQVDATMYARTVMDCHQVSDKNARILACSRVIATGGAPTLIAFAHLNRAHTYQETGDFNRAVADYTRVSRIEPSFAKAYINRGIAYEAMGQKGKAIADFRKALQLDPSIKESKEGLKRLGAAP